MPISYFIPGAQIHHSTEIEVPPLCGEASQDARSYLWPDVIALIGRTVYLGDAGEHDDVVFCGFKSVEERQENDHCTGRYQGAGHPVPDTQYTISYSLWHVTMSSPTHPIERAS